VQGVSDGDLELTATINPLLALRAAVEDAATAARAEAQGASRGAPGGRSPLTLERPPRADLGDYSTNAAMLLAPVLGLPPRAIAERLGGGLRERMGAALERVEVAGPGFLNIFLADAWYLAAAAHLLEAGEHLGAPPAPARRERVAIEFVSANPTGPLTAAGGRHAAYGDALARLLELAGHDVQREYYVNDFGSQVRRLGQSIRARARGEDVPEDGYAGEYVGVLAEEIPGAAGGDVDELARRGVELMLEQIRETLRRFRVEFDTWFSERSLHEGAPSPVDRAYAELEAHGHVYRSEGALWLRSTALGDDKDRVLERSTGEHTYFASDIAYHEHKRARGFDRLIDVLGADHHGYVRRMRAAWAALGGEPDAFELLIMQFVNVLEGGARASMSKRRGEFVTLDDLVADVGIDAARFFMLQRSHDTTVDLDLELARDQSNENPVYYVQYAHARIVSVLAKAGDERVGAALERVRGGAVAAAPLDPSERALVKKLLAFPLEVAEAAERRAPHRMAGYALELAQDFTAFYRDCRVVGAEPAGVEDLRLGLCVSTRRAIASALDLLGVSAPESM
jgi:arginyl-tRNA synthetase